MPASVTINYQGLYADLGYYQTSTDFEVDVASDIMLWMEKRGLVLDEHVTLQEATLLYWYEKLMPEEEEALDNV